MEPVVTETPVVNPVFAPPVLEPRPYARYVLSVGIALILMIFFVMGLSLIHPAPTSEQYCVQQAVTPADSVSCIVTDGIWVPYSGTPETSSAVASTDGVCDLYTNCATRYQGAKETHGLIFFAVLLVVGLAVAYAGVALQIGSATVSSGLLYGGVLTITAGAFAYWGVASDLIRLLMATVTLGILIYLGYRRFHD